MLTFSLSLHRRHSPSTDTAINHTNQPQYERFCVKKPLSLPVTSQSSQDEDNYLSASRRAVPVAARFDSRICGSFPASIQRCNCGLAIDLVDATLLFWSCQGRWYPRRLRLQGLWLRLYQGPQGMGCAARQLWVPSVWRPQASIQKGTQGF